MRAVLELSPTTNFGMSSPQDQTGDMQGLANRLMGLSHPVQLISRCREIDTGYDWPSPPKLTRQWFAVVLADDVGTLTWRTASLKKALDSIGLRGVEVGDDGLE
jgi:hypothetical protein